MTAHPRHAFNVAPGEAQPSLAALIFRPLLRLARRKPAAPAGYETAGAATDPRELIIPDEWVRDAEAGGSDWDDLAEQQRVADALWHGETEPRGFPVLGDKMLSDVRREQDAEPAAPAPWRPSSAMSTGEFRALDVQVDYWRAQPRRPVNGQARPDQPRQAVPFSELNRKFSNGRPTPELLRQVLAGLKKHGTEREATYRGGWQ